MCLSAANQNIGCRASMSSSSACGTLIAFTNLLIDSPECYPRCRIEMNLVRLLLTQERERSLTLDSLAHAVLHSVRECKELSVDSIHHDLPRCTPGFACTKNSTFARPRSRTQSSLHVDDQSQDWTSVHSGTPCSQHCQA